MRFAALTVPTLLLVDLESAPSLKPSTDAVAAAVPGARMVVLAGQAHNAMDADPGRLVAEVLGFVRGGAVTAEAGQGVVRAAPPAIRQVIVRFPRAAPRRPRGSPPPRRRGRIRPVQAG